MVLQTSEPPRNMCPPLSPVAKKCVKKSCSNLNISLPYMMTVAKTDTIVTTCGRELDLSDAELVVERSNSLFSYHIHKLLTGEYVIAEKFYANPFNNRYILLNDEQIEQLKNL